MVLGTYKAVFSFAVVAAGVALVAPQVAPRVIPAPPARQTAPAPPAAPSPPARPSPAAPQAPAPAGAGGVVELRASANGHYYADVVIDGVRISAMVDTGATGVLLSAKDAERLGLFPKETDYTARTNTANGVAAVAPKLFREIRLGSIVVRDVRGAISRPGGVWRSLLGMSFLGKLSEVRAASGRLTLRQ